MKPKRVLKPKTHNLFTFFGKNLDESSSTENESNTKDKKGEDRMHVSGPTIERVVSSSSGVEEVYDGEQDLRICPKCGQKTLKVENGCMTCINPECGYSKCDD